MIRLVLTNNLWRTIVIIKLKEIMLLKELKKLPIGTELIYNHVKVKLVSCKRGEDPLVTIDDKWNQSVSAKDLSLPTPKNEEKPNSGADEKKTTIVQVDPNDKTIVIKVSGDGIGVWINNIPRLEAISYLEIVKARQIIHITKP